MSTTPGRLAAARLTPWAGLVVVLAASVFGLATVRAFNEAIVPELDNRSRLIGTIVRGNIQRALELGIPFEQLRGTAGYLHNVLERFPEVSRIAIRTADARVISLGERRASGDIITRDAAAAGASAPAPRAFAPQAFSFPIVTRNTVVGDIVIEGDPRFIDRQLRDVFLDMIVFVLVALLVAFEIMLAVVTLSVVKPLDRLRALLERQRRGDFSLRLAERSATSLERVAARFSDHSVDLNARFARIRAGRAAAPPRDLDALGQRHGLRAGAPQRLRLADVADTRLPLFVFVLGAELSKSFLPLYVRRAAAGETWLAESLLISLPLAAYLLALVVLSPVAGRMTQRWPARAVFLAALVPVVVSQVGLSLSTSVFEIVLWQAVTGGGFAVASIACQDHALGLAGGSERVRAVGGFIAVVIAGTFCGTAVGGVIADRLGQANVFLVGAGLVLAAGLLAMIMIPAGAAAPTGAPPPGTARPRLLATLRSAEFLVLLLAIAIPANILVAAFLWYLVPLMLAAGGSSPADIGRALMLYYLLVVLLAPRAARPCEHHRVALAFVVGGALLSGGAVLVASQWSGFWPVAAAIALAGIGQALLRAPVVALTLAIGECAPSRPGAGVMLGALRTFERVGSILGLLLAAWLAARFGYAGAAAATGHLVVAGAVVFAVFRLWMALRSREGLR